MKLTYRFPDITHRDRFLKLIASNVGEYGYGFGLEFRGLEFSLEKPNGRGDIHCHISNARGDWTLRDATVEIDMGFIAMHRENIERLRERLWEIAGQFNGNHR